jgi:4-aminobutyrate aminotransferase-like enzyme
LSCVTGDGLPDLLQCASSSVADCKSWVNTGAGWKRDDAYKPTTIFNGKGVRIVDVNGNGLVDYIRQAIACFINNTHTVVNTLRITHIRNYRWWFPVIIELPT